MQNRYSDSFGLGKVSQITQEKGAAKIVVQNPLEVISKSEAVYFFPGLFFILFSHFCSFMVVWGWGLGLDFGVRALYLNIEE